MKKVCVFVGANLGNTKAYLDNTIALAKLLARNDIAVVYGGASVGLMGKLADAALLEGGKVIGVMPKSLMNQEITHDNLSELHVVGSMQERKQMMASVSDGFIVLPGGLGTFEELFEVWNAIKIGLYSKPLGLLNVAGYFNPIIDFLNNSVNQGFIKKNHLDLMTLSEEPPELLDKLNSQYKEIINSRAEKQIV